MSTSFRQGIWALTEKEKQTLRLIVRGHDAKSTARSLGLSVHTINERLRDARRKMAVSSSREAARLLFEAEGQSAHAPAPQLLGDAQIGGDAAGARTDQGSAPAIGAGGRAAFHWIRIGVFLMAIALGLLALLSFADAPPGAPPAPAAARPAANPEALDSARQFLALLDQSDWDGSYRAMGEPFRRLNSARVWADVSEKVRRPLGAAISRTLVSQENLPAPPDGYQVVKFRTRFAARAEALETVTLDREEGSWRVVGVTIE